MKIYYRNNYTPLSSIPVGRILTQLMKTLKHIQQKHVLKVIKQRYEQSITYVPNRLYSLGRDPFAPKMRPFAQQLFFSNATFAPLVLKLHSIICAKNKIYDCAN